MLRCRSIKTTLLFNHVYHKCFICLLSISYLFHSRLVKLVLLINTIVTPLKPYLTYTNTQDPKLYLGFLFLLCPLLSMLTHIQNKGVITDPVEKKKSKKSLKLADLWQFPFEEFFLSFENVSFSNLNPSYLCFFFANILIFRVEKDSSIKKWVIGITGVFLFGDTPLLEAKMGASPQFFSNFLVNCFLKVNT